MTFHVVDETKMEIKVPVIWEFLDTTFHQLHGQIGTTRTLRRLLGKKDRTEFIGRLEFRIEGDRDIQERGQHVIFTAASDAMISEILDGACPVNIGEKSAVAEAHSFEG